VKNEIEFAEAVRSQGPVGQSINEIVSLLDKQNF
jgi:protein subunit release factor B